MKTKNTNILNNKADFEFYVRKFIESNDPQYAVEAMKMIAANKITIEGNDPSVQYPDAKFTLRSKKGTGGLKFAATCIRCQKHMDQGESGFTVRNVGAFHPECVSDAERVFYNEQDSFYHNWLVATGSIERKVYTPKAETDITWQTNDYSKGAN